MKKLERNRHVKNHEWNNVFLPFPFPLLPLSIPFIPLLLLRRFSYDPIKFFVPFLFFPAMPPQVDHPVPGQRGAMVPPKSNSDGNIVLKRSPSKDLKKIFLRAMRTSKMKSLFKFKRSRPRSPVDVVKNATSLLSYLNSPPHSSGTRHAEKVSSIVFFFLRL